MASRSNVLSRIDARKIIKECLDALNKGEEIKLPDRLRNQLQYAIVNYEELQLGLMSPNRKMTHVTNQKPSLDYYDGKDY